MSPLPPLTGGCHCGGITLTVELTAAPHEFHPRACDCDFCRKHGATWVSDPKGTLHIRIGDARDAGRYTQGAGLAEMLLCRRCGVLVAALWQADRLYGVVNARALDVRDGFSATQPVSPQQLSPEAKVSRWQSIWFADVRLATGTLPGK